MKDKTILQTLQQSKTHLKEGSPIAMSQQEIRDIAFTTLQAFVKGTGDILGTPLINRVALICKTKDIEGYLALADDLDSELENYSASTDVELVKCHRVLCSLLKKYPFPSKLTPYDSLAAAKKTWFKAEEQCKRTNERLRPMIEKVTLRPSWVNRARTIISDMLGDTVTRENIREILDSGYHGKGTSTECPFEASSAYYKYSDPHPHCTSDALPYAMAAISRNPRWFANLERSQARQVCSINRAQYELEVMTAAIRITEQERISFVDKSLKTKRPIGVGNSLNMYLQLGVKTLLMRILKEHGIDLNNQDKNRQLAKQGSLEGTYFDEGTIEWLEQLSTIDLASASDTVSLGICELLLPNEWYSLFCDLRHASGKLDDNEIAYDKMSAMGNGFTFPLESLIFYAVLKATTEDQGYEYEQERNAVYGDDIICPLKVAQPLIENLTTAGFSINTEKSFLSGMFKESCGRDYFQGVNVRSFYLKRSFNMLQDFYYVGNRLVPLSLDITSSSLGYRNVYNALKRVASKKAALNFGPLTTLLTYNKKGKRVWIASEHHYSVPLDIYQGTLLGGLKMRDKLAVLNTRKLFRADGDSRNAVITNALKEGHTLYYDVTTSYPELDKKHVSEDTRLLCSFDSKRDEADRGMYDKRNLDLDANGTIKPVLKRSLNYSCSLRYHSSWNGIMRTNALERHPVRDCVA